MNADVESTNMTRKASETLQYSVIMAQECVPKYRKLKNKINREKSCECVHKQSKLKSGETWRIALAEAVGTALLVLLCCMPSCVTPALPAMHNALASGFVVALLVQCFDHISGAMFNPTVTIAALVTGRLPRTLACVMMVAQIAGGVVGGLLLQHVGSQDSCLTLPSSRITMLQAVIIEAVLGGCLALANCASWDPRNRPYIDSWPLRIGSIVAGLSLTAGDLTGASMNPVRSLGPVIASGNWTAHWIYWLGPLSGSLVCSVLYMIVWRVPPDTAPRNVTLPPNNTSQRDCSI